MAKTSSLNIDFRKESMKRVRVGDEEESEKKEKEIVRRAPTCATLLKLDRAAKLPAFKVSIASEESKSSKRTRSKNKSFSTSRP